MEKQQVLKSKPQEVYAMACTGRTHAFHNICTHLSLGVCPCITTQTHPSPSGASIKRKSCHEAPIHARKRVRSNNPEERRWGYSTTLMLYDDPWKIKKVLTESDLGNLSRLLLSKDLARDLVLPVLGADAQRDAQTENGTQIRIWDVDTNSMHYLVFKRWVSSRSYVFIGNWNQDFVKRKGLKRGDEIGLHWDPYKNHFDFSVLQTYLVK